MLEIQSVGEAVERGGEYEHAAFQVFRGCVFVGAVTDSGTARDEEHPGRRHPRHEERIVIRAADHGLVMQSAGVGRRAERIDDECCGFGGRVGIQDLAVESDATGRSDGLRPALNDGQHGVAAGEIGVADIGQDSDQARDAVHRSRKDFADADRTDGVDRSRPLSGGFDGERQFGSRQKSVAAIGHEDGAGVAAFAFELES